MYAVFYSVVYHQNGVQFTLEGDGIPGFLRGSKKGNIFISTQKVGEKIFRSHSITQNLDGKKVLLNLSGS